MLFSRASTTCQLSSYCESFLGCLMRLPPSVQVPSRTPLNSRITNANLLLHPLLIRLCHNVSAAIAGASAYSFRSHRPKGLAIYSFAYTAGADWFSVLLPEAHVRLSVDQWHCHSTTKSCLSFRLSPSTAHSILTWPSSSLSQPRLSQLLCMSCTSSVQCC